MSSEEVELGAELREDLGLSFVLASDPALTVIESYGVRHEGEDLAVPAIFVIDAKGVIRYSHIGESMIDRPDSAGLADLVEQLGNQLP